METTSKTRQTPQAEAAKPNAPAAPAPVEQEPAGLSTKAILAAINDGADDPATVKALNDALYLFGAQDPTLELPRSWQRVQRRLGIQRNDPPEELDGIATAEQVRLFADRAGLALAK